MKGGKIEEALLGLYYLKEKALLNEKGDTFARSKRLASVINDILVKKYPKNTVSWDKTDRLTFFVTRSCQLRCDYCSVDKFQGHMPLAAARRGVELLMAGRRKDVELHFIGGEPLIRFNVIAQIVEIAERLKIGRKKTTRYVVSTNGFDFNEKMIALFKRYNFHISTSLDGGEDISGAQRTGIAGRNHFQRIVSNIEKLKRNGIPYMVTVVVTPASASSMERNVLAVLALGHKKITINYETGCYWPKKALRDLLNGFGHLANLAHKNKDWALLNALGEAEWVEPHVLDPDLTLDIDGGIYPITVIVIQQALKVNLHDFILAPVSSIENLEELRISPLELLLAYSKLEAWRDPTFRRLIINNVEVGFEVRNLLRRLRPGPKQFERTKARGSVGVE